MRKEILFGLGAASLILGAAAASRYGQSAGLIDGDTGKRVVQVVIGLYLAWYGNRMPKSVGKWSSLGGARWSQSVLRVGGWSLTLAGLAHALLWATQPMPVARPAAMIVVATATLVTMGYAVWALAVCRRAS